MKKKDSKLMKEESQHREVDDPKQRRPEEARAFDLEADYAVLLSAG